MKAQLVLAIFIAVALTAIFAADTSNEDKKDFKEWCEKFNKKYQSKEEEDRAMKNVLMHKSKIDAHNKLYKEGKKHHSMKLNEHSDMTIEEMKQRLGGAKLAPNRSKRELHTSNMVTKPPPLGTPPDAIDWRDHGLVTRVENQNPCGSCWAFSVAAVVNALVRKHNKDSTVLVSPQELVDCDDNAAFGCGGGDPAFALQWISEHGITSESDYPYRGNANECKDKKDKNIVANVSTSYEIILNGNETQLKEILGNVGPVAVLICLEEDFYHYGDGGVYKHDGCCTAVEHAPTLVGYGTDPTGGDYWILKNSWGTTWGNNGYMKMARNYPERNGNMCNVARMAVWGA